MWFMGFSKANCKNCYACVRVCSVHAIKIKNEQAQIIKERCIVCGKCFKACPQNAKLIKSEKDTVKHYIKSDNKVFVSIAPSFAAIFGEYSNKLPKALKILGFDYIEETASIADPIIKEYERYANEDNENTYITSFCPPVNDLIQKYYKDLVKCIIPVASPSILHARDLKNRYGNDIKVVFIGPCLAKKLDGHDEDAIDIVLTFEELEKWFKEENIDLKNLEEEPFDYVDKQKRLLPIIGGPTKVIEENNPKKSIIQVDGIKDCMEVLNQIQKGNFKNALIDMNSCTHSCINGSGMSCNSVSLYERKENLKTYAKNCSKEREACLDEKERAICVSIEKQFIEKEVLLNQPNEKELKEILNNMGKHKVGDELNCGSCGYHTCREKAVAVYNDMAQISMCLPFMRERAEDLSNIIFEITPNVIVIIDKNLDIAKINPSAETFFNISNERAKGISIGAFLEENKFKKVKETRENVYKERVKIDFNQATVIENIIWLEKNQAMLWIADDISQNEQLQEKIKNMKIDAVNMAQQVINKQMTVAQEIASLLGETTAETKVTLTQLKNLIQEESNF